MPDAEPLIYRQEVLAIMGVLADLLVDVRAILDELRGEHEEEEE